MRRTIIPPLPVMTLADAQARVTELYEQWRLEEDVDLIDLASTERLYAGRVLVFEEAT